MLHAGRRYLASASAVYKPAGVSGFGPAVVWPKRAVRGPLNLNVGDSVCGLRTDMAMEGMRSLTLSKGLQYGAQRGE